MDPTVKETYILGLYIYDLIEDNLNILAYNGLFDLTSIGADADARSLFLMNNVQVIICTLVALPNIDTMTLYEKMQVVTQALSVLGLEIETEEAL